MHRYAQLLLLFLNVLVAHTDEEEIQEMQQNYRIVRCARSWGSSLTLSDSRFGMSCRSALFGVLLLRFLLCSALTPEPAGPLLHLPFCHRIEWPHRFQYTSSWTTYVLFGHSSYAGALHTPDPIP